MASLARRRPENAPGDFYVDATCIDCDTCRWMAPETFHADGGQSSVHRQPQDEAEAARALMALVACPTASIGTVRGHEMAATLARFPDRIEGDVNHCGYHHESSFGAASYLIVRPRGNVLIDSPRFTAPLVRRLEELGGVHTMFLTHVDDIADHQRFRDHFGCERILHAGDATGELRRVERLADGRDPIPLDDAIALLPVPGHTRGSTCLLLRETHLFSGDHVAWSHRRGHVYAFRDACWYDWRARIESMRSLAEQRFEWILPGHGRRSRFPAPAMRARIERAVRWMGGTEGMGASGD